MNEIIHKQPNVLITPIKYQIHTFKAGSPKNLANIIWFNCGLFERSAYSSNICRDFQVTILMRERKKPL